MDPAEVIAIEVPQFEGQGIRTLVPRVYGQTSASETRKHKPGNYPRWNEERFFDAMATRADSACVNAAREILDWIRPRVRYIWWGTGKATGSFIPMFTHAGVDHQLFVVYTYAKVEICFQWYMSRRPFDSEEKRAELLRKLNEIPDVSLSEGSIDKRPGIPISTLANKENLDRFKGVFEWYIEQIRAL